MPALSTAQRWLLNIWNNRKRATLVRAEVVNIITKNKNIVRVALGTAFILLIPLVAMQFTDDVNWDVTDFVVAGALLLGTGLMLELTARKWPKHRVVIGIVLSAALVYVWAELAVGIFTTWGS